MHHHARYFLAQLSLPVRKIMAATAVDCARHVAQTLGFNKTEIFGVKMAVEEAFINATNYYPDEVGPDELIYLDFFVENDALIISVRDKGIPFDQKRAAQFSADNSCNSDARAMHTFMDSVTVLSHGRDGREVRLTKRIQTGTLPAELVDDKQASVKKPRTTVKAPLIRLARRADDLAEVCRLAWRCYGFTHEELLYDPGLLTEKVAKGEFKSVIAIDPESGRIFGHIGLKYHCPDDPAPELGLAFVDPAFRSPQVPLKMANVLFDIAEADGAKGIFDCSVTTHTFSQKGMQDRGSRPCCIMLGIAASGMQAKELKTSRQAKGSVVNHYYAFDHSRRTIYIPPHHQAMVNDIYGWMEVPRDFGTPAVTPPAETSSISVIDLPDALNASFIIVHAIGAETAAEVGIRLRQCRTMRKDAVFAFIPTNDAASPALVEQCEAMGFFFSGVMPHIHGGEDRILLQFVDIPINLDAIKVYGDMTRTLFDYITREQLKALGPR
ncbi:anti-sigma regulatory factor (Ser/Thr protein kinase) [Desulfobaculum xiamenense]|uniref:Anti-sigma regulatory factor (Ser/Thr protein kinase) n=1 Tax=Desulfobaculum xiamenense TaxID=995050 RepID=A0A846QM99_9BACT|nr:ATP-binding protein [Desulfobaculum xiamenense]NJB69278.1 anti-sigma regulatory factor (Ser/Thr protein kinase) [Desulfobaculum xiamenense]